MSKSKIYFCLFLLLVSFVYLYTKLSSFNLYEIVSNQDIVTVVSSNSPIKLDSTVFKEDNRKRNNLLEKPIVYFYNTHQTEEYKSSKNYKPTVVTASKVLEKTLKNKGMLSLVETRSIKKKLDEYGYDYSGTYAVSFEYLKDSKKKNPSLKYFFDVHRDSIVGKDSRVNINGKNYATMMFLVGQNHKNYKKNVKNIKMMGNYLNKHYQGLLRDTYYQPKYSYNQEYDENMFLVEIGGPNNTLEEITNTSIALGDAISNYVEVNNEK